MTHDRDTIDDLVLRAALGELSGPEAEACERLLATDPALAGEVTRLRQALAALPYAAVTAPPAELRSRVLAAAEKAATAPGVSTPSLALEEEEPVRAGAARPARRGDALPATRAGARRTGGRRTGGVARRWTAGLAVAAAVIAVVLGVDALRLRRDLALQREVSELLQQPNVVVAFSLAGAGSSASAYGAVLMDMDSARGALAVHGMAPPPAGHVYRLWAVSAGKNVLCGQFTVDREQAARAQFVVPVRAYEGPVERVFVTLEPTSETPTPTGPRVLEST